MAAKHGYLLPEVVDPERICVQIEIPNDQRHLLAFWGQIEALGSALSWDNDPEHTALPVSAVWRDVYKIARDKFYGEGCMGCCPDELEVDYNTYRQTQINYQQFLRMMDDGDTAASFGAPSTFDGDASPNRQYALCRTVNRLVHSAFNDAAMALQTAADVARMISFGSPVQPISGIVGTAVSTLTRQLLRNLASDCDAIREVSCCLREALEGQDTTIENLQGALGGCEFGFGSNQAQIASMVNSVIQNRDNARAVIAAMNEDYESAGMESGASAQDCECDCECEDLDIVALNDCVVTPLGNCQWRITQTNYTPMGISDPFCGGDDRKQYVIEFANHDGACIDVIGANQAMAGYDQIGCDDIPISGVGGGGGQGKFFRWYLRNCWDDPTTWDVIITVAPVE